MLISIGLILIIGFGLYGVFVKLRLPGLLGLLLAGILLGPHAFDLIDPSLLAISADLREIALIVILVRAGLSLDLKDLRKVGRCLACGHRPGHAQTDAAGIWTEKARSAISHGRCDSRRHLCTRTLLILSGAASRRKFSIAHAAEYPAGCPDWNHWRIGHSVHASSGFSPSAHAGYSEGSAHTGCGLPAGWN